MGNSGGGDLCDNSLYLCNIFKIQNKPKRSSLSLPRKIINAKNNLSYSVIENEIILNQSQIENGANILNMNNLNTVRSERLKKFILINSNSKDNDANNISNIKLKSINKNEEKMKLSSEIKQSLFNNEILNEKNLSIGEEKTINNCSSNSIYSYVESTINKKIENKELKETNKDLNKNNNINDKDIELCEESIKSLKSNEKKEKKEQENNNFIKGLKTKNFAYSRKSMIKAQNKGNRFSLLPRIKGKNSIIENNINLNNSFHSIPEVRHQDPNHPLNLLILKRQIKSSLYPLNKKSFNIVTYKEDNSQQYSYFENGLANGVTKYIVDKKNKIIFEGEFKNGNPKGYGKFSLINEERYYEGIWDNTLLIGVETYKDGTLYIGEFQNNKKEGVGMYRWPDGTIYYGEWKNDNMQGFCYIKFADDRKYEGQMNNGVKNGYGEFTWKSIRKYIGNYVNDLKEGFGIYIWNIKTFEIYIGFWYKGKMEGIGMIINGDNKHFGKWSKGKKIEAFKNERDFKLKLKSTESAIRSSLINQRGTALQNEKKNMETNSNNNNSNSTNNKNINKKAIEKKISYINEAKIELEKKINFMCQDTKIIKSLILSLFFKSNEFL